jgi:hypothetical protein
MKMQHNTRPKLRTSPAKAGGRTASRSGMNALASLLSVALWAGALPLFASTPGASAVGEVSLVLGKAYVRSVDGGREPLRIGMSISVDDIIETGTNGHVHVRFVDQALVSVRPSSTLEILRYDYDQQNPAASTVKLNLIEGVTRAISGKAAKEARQNFRMNTPIAAIGVRGTDFVVSASKQSVRAFVNEGTIVVAPFSGACTAEAFGPCSQNSLELAGGAAQIIEISAKSVAPVLLQIPGKVLPETILEQSDQILAETGKTEHEKAGGSDIYTDSVTTMAVSRKIADGKELVNNFVPPPPPPPPTPEYTPDVVVPAEVLTQNTQLVWGRWAGRQLENERITVSYAQAFSEGRQITIGNDHYALFRLENGSKELKPGLGILAFNLTQAQAYLSTEKGAELMDVYGGLLNINIDERLYSTSLQLGHAATGKFAFTDSGHVFGGGIFRNRTDDKVTVGSLSIDGTEAGYFFETTVDAGKIEGLTLWSVQP